MSTSQHSTLHKQVFVDAAVRCFNKYGPKKTTMGDIAKEAGTSRQSIYRFFEDRTALVQYILAQQISQTAEHIAEQFSKFKTIEKALVEGSILSIHEARANKLINTIITTSTDHSIELFLVNSSEEIRYKMMSFWAPLLEKARLEGRIRNGVTNEKILEWIRNVHTVLMIRDDKEANQREMLENFFLPSILSRFE